MDKQTIINSVEEVRKNYKGYGVINQLLYFPEYYLCNKYSRDELEQFSEEEVQSLYQKGINITSSMMQN